MDPQQRITELEAQVRALTDQVRQLSAANGQVPARTAGRPAAAEKRPPRWITRVTLGTSVALLLLTALAALRGSQSLLADFSPGAVAALLISHYWFTACAALLAVAVIFIGLRRPLVASILALLSTYTAYAYLSDVAERQFDLGPATYFWTSNGLLTLLFAVVSTACIADAQHTRRGQRWLALLAGINAALYFCFTWMAVAQQFPDDVWVQRITVAGLLGLFTVLAESSGVRRNPVFHMFLAATLLVASFTLQAVLPPEKLSLALAIECLALSAFYKQSGIVVFKVVGVMLLIPVLTGNVLNVKIPGAVVIAGQHIASTWFYGLGCAAVLAVTAMVYEKFARRLSPSSRTHAGHWFLADSWLDVPGATAAMLHAAAAAIIVLILTIMDRGDTTALPYLLGLLSLAMVCAGGVLRTPQVQVGGVLLLVGAHVSYYFFLGLARADFETQHNYVMYTTILGAYSFVAAFAWEKYLARIMGRGNREHMTVAAVPYCAAVVLVATLIARVTEGAFAPVMQNLLGIALLLFGTVLKSSSLKGAGLLSIGIGSATFLSRLYLGEARLPQEPYFMVALLLMLLTYALAERLLCLVKRQSFRAGRVLDLGRVALFVTAVVLIGFAVYEWTALYSGQSQS